MPDWIKESAKWLFSRPPHYYAIAYVVLLFGAAVVFWALPRGSFSDTNLRLEPGVRKDATRLLEAITPEVSKERRRQTWMNGTETESLKGLFVRAASITVPPNATPGTLAIAFRGDVSSPHLSGVFESWFTIRVAGAPVIISLHKSAETLFEATATGADGVGAPTRTQFLPPANVILPNNRGGETPLLELQPEAAERLERFDRAQQGDPKAASGLFFRMLYFSASTVTTLGIGDIQPVGEEARIFVTLEAILGVVLIGLFLNALARRSR